MMATLPELRTGTEPANSPPRDMTGTPAHIALRAALGVPPGGRAPRPSNARKSDNPVTNLTATILKRLASRQDELREKALEAWADYQAGAMINDLKAKYHMAGETLVSQWKQAGLDYRPRGRGAGTKDRSDEARAAWQDRQDGYSMKYVLRKHNFCDNTLYRYWREMGLKPPGQKRMIR